MASGKASLSEGQSELKQASELGSLWASAAG